MSEPPCIKEKEDCQVEDMMEADNETCNVELPCTENKDNNCLPKNLIEADEKPDNVESVEVLLPGRLSKEVVPISYELRFVPYMDGKHFMFDGYVAIKINITKERDRIVLHNRHLYISSLPQLFPELSVKTINLEAIRVTAEDVTTSWSTDLMTILFPKNILPGIYTLVMEFRGCPQTLSGRIIGEGFLRTKFINMRGKEVTLASTSFYPIGARRAFPCFDEPRFRATFVISIKHTSDYRAISNMRIMKIKTNDDDGSVWTTFKESPCMATHSVSFAIMDFSYVRDEDRRFRIWMEDDVLRYGKYAVDIGPKLMKEYERYTDISLENLGLKSIEFLAIPSPIYKSGAGWGLVSCWNQNALAGDVNITPVRSLQNIVTGLSRNLAIQWFGHLISPSWWKHVWLIDGFANYFHFYMAHKVLPEWRLMDQMVIQHLQGMAFIFDGQSHEIGLLHADSVITVLGDRIIEMPYYKGGVILRMISHILTESKFQKSIKAYLQSRKFRASNSSNLFNSLMTEFSENSGINKDEFSHAMYSWVRRPGYPIISMTRDFSGTKMKIEQERFLFESDPEGVYTNKYWIPLNFAQSKRCFDTTEVTHWMKPTDDSITISIPNTDGWVIFNKQQFGYYRVNYDYGDWLRIIKKLKSPNFEDIHVLNRAQLIDDVLNLARVSRLDYGIAFELTFYLKQEKDIIPWLSAVRGFWFLYERLVNTEFYDKFKSYLMDILYPLEDILDLNINYEDKHMILSLGSELFRWACKSGSIKWNDYSSELLEAWIKKPNDNPLPVDLKLEILRAGIRYAGRDTWNEVFKIFLKTRDLDILIALGCSEDEMILNDYLDMVHSGMDIDKMLIVDAIYKGSDKGINIVLDFLIENGKNIKGSVFYEMEPICIFQRFWCLNRPGLRLNNENQIRKLIQFKIDLLDWPRNVVEAIDRVLEDAMNHEFWLNKRKYELQSFFSYHQECLNASNALIIDDHEE